MAKKENLDLKQAKGIILSGLKKTNQPNYFIAKARNRYSKGSKAALLGAESIFITIPKDYRDLKGIVSGVYLKITVEVLTNER